MQGLVKNVLTAPVETYRLDQVAELKRGQTITRKSVVEGSIPVIAGGREPAYYHNTANRDGETIVVAGSGAYAGYVSWWETPIFVSDAFSIKPNPEIVRPKFIYYWLQNRQEQIHSLKTGGGVPHVYTRNLAPLKVPIPDQLLQDKIIEVLDNFAALEAELEAELKAELEARKKQYGYYRDVLLTFEQTAPPPRTVGCRWLAWVILLVVVAHKRSTFKRRVLAAFTTVKSTRIMVHTPRALSRIFRPASPQNLGLHLLAA